MDTLIILLSFSPLAIAVAPSLLIGPYLLASHFNLKVQPQSGRPHA